jgi:hypothetical protein
MHWYVDQHNNKQQTTNNKQQTTNNKQPTTNNKQQTHAHIQQVTKITKDFDCGPGGEPLVQE